MISEKLLVVMVLCVVMTRGVAVPVDEYPYVLVWSDEFDGEAGELPDEEKWGYDVGGSGWGNQELQYYTEARAENAGLDGEGNLVIRAIREDFGGREYTSARLVTRNKGDWLYGKFEIRALLPAGRGTWPAGWMLPTDWEYGGWPASGEIDIIEHVGYDMNRLHGTIHTEAYNHTKGTQIGSSYAVEDVVDTYHIYSMEWRPARIDVFVDGIRYFTVTNEGTGYAAWPFDKRFHLLLNIAVGGNWGGAQGVDESAFPQEMVVDYVRVYSIEDYNAAPAHPVPGRIEVEDFSAQSGIRLEQTEDVDGEVNAGWIDNGDWLEVRVGVETAGKYSVSTRYASLTGTGGLSVLLDGVELLEESALASTGDWQNWSTAELGIISLPAGESTLRFNCHISGSSSDLNLNWFAFVLEEADEVERWEDYPVDERGWVNTGAFMGFIYVSEAPWVYSDQLNHWLYWPETGGGDSGYFMFVPH